MIRQSASTTRQEAIASLVHVQEEVDIAWIGFDYTELAEVLHFDDTEIAAFVAEETDRIAEEYAKRREEFDRPARISLRHILIARDIADTDQAEAREGQEAENRRHQEKIRVLSK